MQHSQVLTFSKPTPSPSPSKTSPGWLPKPASSSSATAFTPTSIWGTALNMIGEASTTSKTTSKTLQVWEEMILMWYYTTERVIMAPYQYSHTWLIRTEAKRTSLHKKYKKEGGLLQLTWLGAGVLLTSESQSSSILHNFLSTGVRHLRGRRTWSIKSSNTS